MINLATSMYYFEMFLEFKLRYGSGRHESTAAVPAHAAVVRRTRTGRLLGQSRVQQYVLLFPLALGLVQKGVGTRRRGKIVGSAVDQFALSEFPPSHIRRDLGEGEGCPDAERLWVYGNS